MLKRAAVLALLAALIPASSLAAKAPFSAQAKLQPTGCTTSFAGTVVSLKGCVASASFAGTSTGTVDLAYTATANLTSNKGSQQGTLTFHGTAARDLLVLRFKGTVTVSAGLSTGSWTAVKKTGSFVKLAPSTGTYSSHSPDRGATVSFAVHG